MAIYDWLLKLLGLWSVSIVVPPSPRPAVKGVQPVPIPASVFDDFGRPAVDDITKQAIRDAFRNVDPGKRGALLVRADTDGNAIAQVAAKLGKDGDWKVAGGAAFKLGEKRPTGYVAIERSW